MLVHSPRPAIESFPYSFCWISIFRIGIRYEIIIIRKFYVRSAQHCGHLSKSFSKNKYKVIFQLK